jgi:hypothetical protein
VSPALTSSTSSTVSPPVALTSEGRPPAAPWLTYAMGALVATDLVGGVLAVATGVNTWSEAWGPAALLAAPAPMVLGQVLLALLSAGVVRRVPSRWAAALAQVLALACLVSVASGFLDGGLGNRALAPGLVAYQVFLLLVTAAVGGLATARAVVLLRRS